MSFVLLAFWPIEAVVAQPIARPDENWQSAADHYLAGEWSVAEAIVLDTTPAALLESARRAFERWRAVPAADPTARRVAARRFQASAILPLKLLMATTGRVPAPDAEPMLETAAREAWQRLDAFDEEHGGFAAAQVRRFRTWWRLGLVQHRIASGLLAEARQEAFAIDAPAADVAAVAALALLRGVAIETRARLADEPLSATTAVSLRRLPTASRIEPMLLAMDDAGKHYRRALAAMPGDREATLRLARMALERDRLPEAERLLAPLLTQACPDAVCGLAYLFSGEVYEARKDLERAASAYARASAVPAVRHSALVAMMQAAMRRGSAGGAYDLTHQFATPVALAPGQPPDAWNVYTSGRLIEGDRILAHMTAALVP